MSTSDLLELLGLKPEGEIRWGLSRTRQMLRAVGDPHMAFRSIHVGGTNGKGSVAAMLASIMESAGHRVGLYTSPHLMNFAERINIAGRPAEAELLERAARRLRPFAQELGATFFETTTVLAFMCFAEVGIEFAVAEVGLGGRLDATNVLLPDVTVITQVAWDHADYLGGSLTSIGREKAGICKPGVPLVIGRLDAEVREVVCERARRAAAPVLELGRDAQVRDITIGISQTRLSYTSSRSRSPLPITCPLIGEHQAENAALAILASESLPLDARPGTEAIRDGIRTLNWPGRLQIERRRGVTWVLDVAHNRLALEAMARAVAGLDLPRPLVPVIAILGDKPWKDMLAPVLALGSPAIFTVAPSSPFERRWDPVAVAEFVGGSAVEVIENFDAALARAADIAATILVTGSNHTVGDAMKHLGMAVGLPYSQTLG